jgi:2-hydroxychromene-2-carboxylate isomerase
VRTRRLRIELRPIAFLGPDSAKGAAATVAAGMQGRMWQFADLFYRNQGRENSGYVTPGFVGRIAEAVPGLDIARLRRASGSRELRLELEANARSARTAGITGTPGFRLGRTGGVLTTFEQGPIERRDFLRRLEAAIGGR